eukprot:g29917.t1
MKAGVKFGAPTLPRATMMDEHLGEDLVLSLPHSEGLGSGYHGQSAYDPPPFSSALGLPPNGHINNGVGHINNGVGHINNISIGRLHNGPRLAAHATPLSLHAASPVAAMSANSSDTPPAPALAKKRKRAKKEWPEDREEEEVKKKKKKKKKKKMVEPTSGGKEKEVKKKVSSKGKGTGRGSKEAAAPSPPPPQNLTSQVTVVISDPKATSRRWTRRWETVELVDGRTTQLLKWGSDEPEQLMKSVDAPFPNDDVMMEVTTTPNGKRFACSSCSKTFPDANALRKHARIHGDKPHICPEPGCGKRFRDNSKLKRHSLVHTGERPFSCPYPNCARRFSLDFNLRSHLRVHTGEKPFSCKQCSRKFSQSSNLHAHELTHENKTTRKRSKKDGSPDSSNRTKSLKKSSSDGEMKAPPLSEYDDFSPDSYPVHHSAGDDPYSSPRSDSPTPLSNPMAGSLMHPAPPVSVYSHSSVKVVSILVKYTSDFSD